MTPPRLTVFIPVYNGERFLDEAIESVLSQDFHDFELLIVDDASVDATPSILARWAGKDRRIVVLRNLVNRGAAATANAGLAAARGEYLARQDADDVSLPGRLRREVEALDACPEAVMVSTDFQIIDERGRRLRIERRAQPPEIIEYQLNFLNAIGGHSQVMFRTSVVRELGGYDETRRTGEDYELWTRLVRRGPILVLPLVSMSYRMHAAQATAAPRDEASRRRAVEFSRTLLSSWIGRELTVLEAEAATTGGGSGSRANARLAHAVHGEAFRIFAERVRGDRALCTRVRTVIASRLAFTAVLLLAAGQVGHAAAYLAASVRWNAPAALRSLFGLLAQSAGSRLRAALWRKR